MRIQTIGAMGDEVAMTAAVREAKRQRPDEMIMIYGARKKDVWENCPYINIGNEEDGRLIQAYSFHRDHRGSRTQLYFKLLKLDPARIKDELPELWWTREELASPILVKATGRKTETKLQDLEEVLAGAPAPIIAVDPGAGWPSRRWPEERFSELTSRLAALGYTVIQVGSRQRMPLAGIAHDLVGRMKIRTAARFLGRCDLYIGNDSGFFHLAAAVGCPHVTIYGPTRYTCGPYPETISVFPAATCSRRCFEFCGRTAVGDSKINHCMEEISVDQVLEAAKEALARPRPASRLVPAPKTAEAWERFHASKEGSMNVGLTV